jgi:hypothetical protein
VLLASLVSSRRLSFWSKPLRPTLLLKGTDGLLRRLSAGTRRRSFGPIFLRARLIYDERSSAELFAVQNRIFQCERRAPV